jgi:hypothetical protein
MTAAGKRLIGAAKEMRERAKPKHVMPLNMTAAECRERLAAEKRNHLCLPQDIEYWQFWIDFHEHGFAEAVRRQTERRNPIVGGSEPGKSWAES